MLKFLYGKAVFILILGLALGAPPRACLGQEENRHPILLIMRGGVVSVDTERAAFVLATDVDEVTVSVPKEAVIFRGAERVDFPDIEKDDFVTVSFYYDENHQMKVLSITLEA